MKKTVISVFALLLIMSTPIFQLLPVNASDPIEDFFNYKVKGDNTICITFIRSNAPSTIIIPAEINGLPVTQFGDEFIYPFMGVSFVTSITLPESIVTIAPSAFSGGTNLSEINLPNSIQTIGYDAFYNTALYNNESNWYNGCLYINNYFIKAKQTVSGAFSVADGTKVIASYAFSGCNSITSLTVPDSVKYINAAAFTGCSSLTSITLPFIGQSRTENGFIGYCYGANSYTENAVTVPTSLKTVTVSNTCTSLAPYAFYGCSALQEITLSTKISELPLGTFMDCMGLQKVNINATIQKIENYASAHCIQVPELHLTANPTIANLAFHGCDLTLYGYVNSSVQTNAVKNGLTFEPESNVRFDVDFDGTVSIIDLVALKKICSSIPRICNTAMVDSNKDGKIDALDLIELRKFILGVKDKTPGTPQSPEGNVYTLYKTDNLVRLIGLSFGKYVSGDFSIHMVGGQSFDSYYDEGGFGNGVSREQARQQIIDDNMYFYYDGVLMYGGCGDGNGYSIISISDTEAVVYDSMSNTDFSFQYTLSGDKLIIRSVSGGADSYFKYYISAGDEFVLDNSDETAKAFHILN